MKPRVLIFRADLLPPSETFIAAQAAALRRYQAVFAGLRQCSPSLPLPVAHTFHPGGRLGRLLCQKTGFAPGLVQALRQQSPCLLHAHFAVDAALALPLRRSLRLPMLVTLHGYDVMRTDAAHSRTRAGRFYLARREQLWREAALFLCVSDAIRLQAEARGFPAHKLRVLPIGIDLQMLTPSYGSSGEREPVILFVGRLVLKKGCRQLIEAMALVQRAIPAARLILAGDGPERPTLERAAAGLTTGTRFLGTQTAAQVHALMRAARCLAAPSMTAPDGDAEGLPTVLCEALALGLPVASTVHSGIPELIQHGEHGLLSQEGDVEALAQNLIQLCSDTSMAERLAHAGRLRVEQSFDLHRQTALLEDVYDEVAASQQHMRSAPKPRILAAVATSQENALHSSVAEPSPVTVREDSESRLAQAAVPPRVKAESRLRHQAAWLLSGNGATLALQAIYFLLIGRLLGAREYGGFVGAVALINVLSQFSSLGMEMVLLRTIARDRTAFAVAWGRALAVSGAGFIAMLLAVSLYGHFFLPHALLQLLPYLVLSDALFGKLTQLSSRALQGAGFIQWSAKLGVMTNVARTVAAGLLYLWASHSHSQIYLLTWVRLYCGASFIVALVSLGSVTKLLGRPCWAPIRRHHLLEGLSFSFSSSAISLYNDLDKAMLVSYGMLAAAGIYGAAYRVIDVVSTPIVSLFAAASPRLFRSGAQAGPAGVAPETARLLRWAACFGLLAAPLLAVCAPLLPRLFGHSFAASTGALQMLCFLPLLRGLHYAWGTAITSCASQWLRTATQAGAALLNLLLNVWLIPRWGWQGAAAASLLTDGALALASFTIFRFLIARQQAMEPAPSQELAQAS